MISPGGLVNKPFNVPCAPNLLLLWKKKRLDYNVDQQLMSAPLKYEEILPVSYRP